MRPKNLKTKIFLDSGDPQETKKIIKVLGFLDGQTTNPSLITKNPQAIKRIQQGKKFSKNEISSFYRNIVEEISNLIPRGSVSVEVYSDFNTSAADMINEAKKMNSWIPNAHIKLPIIKEGLLAAHELVKNGVNVNMTLCFNQNQAIAVSQATKGAKKGSVFLSPFIGRLDDIGEDGMSLISNILRSYRIENNSHVEVLAASVRNLPHLLSAISMECDIVTVPYSVLLEWVEKGCEIPRQVYKKSNTLKRIKYEKTKVNEDEWGHYNIEHDLTKKGIEKFCSDWNSYIK